MILDYKSPYLKSLDLDSSEAATISTLVKAAQGFVEKYCNRKFESQEFDKVFQVRQDGSIILESPPVSAIYRIAFTSGCNLTLSSTAPVANYSITPNGLNLRSFESGAWVNQSLPFATHPTLSQLKNAITGSWTGTLNSGTDSLPSSDLVSDQFGSCANNQKTMVYSWADYSGTYSFNHKTGIIDGIFNSWGYGNGTSDAWNEYTYYGGWGSFAASWGYYGGYFSRGKRVRVVYEGGFNPVPEEIKMLIADLVISAYSGPEGRVQSETIGDYQYTLADMDKLAMSDKKILNLYKDRIG